jgi:oxygen-independent coproporphyrinogen III oxidase
MRSLPCRKTFFEKASPAHPAGSLYVHVPFCRKKCRYCDFCSVSYSGELAQDVSEAMIQELSLGATALQIPLQTVFIGGGTPTVLEKALLEGLLSAIGPLCDGVTEFSIEANPNSVSADILGLLKKCGVNRLSMGVQSFIESELQLLGRLHSPQEAHVAWKLAREAGFGNLSLDLIYGIPGQTMDTWKASLDQAIELSPDHISAYCLSFEEGTPLADDLAAGRVSPMDESLQRDCYYFAIERLEQAGLNQYEISNYARPGRECGHNLVYWHNESYLGIGPSAVSYIDGERSTNDHDLSRYVAAVSAGRRATESSEHVTGRLLQAETLMLGLRLRAGVDRAAFRQRFGCDAVESFPTAIEKHARIGMLNVTPTAITLTPQALFVSDAVLSDIVAEA